MSRPASTSSQSSTGTTAIDYEWFLGADGTVCQICEKYADSAAALEDLGNFALGVRISLHERSGGRRPGVCARSPPSKPMDSGDAQLRVARN